MLAQPLSPRAIALSPRAELTPPRAAVSVRPPERPPRADVTARAPIPAARYGTNEGRAARRMRACARFGRLSK
eukprot:11857276-Alexandrium_andersonii.AAC.1